MFSTYGSWKKAGSQAASMVTSQEVESVQAFLEEEKGALKGKGQTEALVKGGTSWLEGSVFTE